MTFESLFLACSDMEFKSHFVVTLLTSEINSDVYEYPDWYSVPEDFKEREVFAFSFYKNEWYVTIR